MRIQKVAEYIDERGIPYIEAVHSGDNDTYCIKTFWSIYVKDKNGFEHCIGDYKTERDAKTILKMIERYYAKK